MKTSSETRAEIAREIADSLMSPETDPARDWMAEIDARVAECCPESSPGDQLALTNRVTARLNDRLNLGLPKLTLHRPPAAIPPLRDAQWSRDAATVIALRQALDAQLEARSPSTDALPLLILASAALRGGLWRAEALLALADCLAKGHVPLERVEAFAGLAGVDLELTINAAQQLQTNTVAGAELLRWFPDVTTLSLISRWTRRAPLPFTAPTTAKRLFTQMLEALDATAARAQLSPKRFAAVAPAALEAVSGVALPVAIEAVASGQAPGLSVTGHSWHALATRGKALSAALSAAPSPTGQQRTQRGKPAKRAPQKEHLHTAVQAFEHLRRAHSGSSSRKGSKTLAEDIHRLQLAHGADWPAFGAVLGWYRSLLASGDKPRTISEYHGKVGQHILEVFDTVDPHALSPTTLRDLFEQVLSRSGYADPTFPLQRIAHFASHAQQVHDWPEADIAELGEGRDRTRARFVRTAMLPMTVYPEVFEAIRNATGIRPEMAECYAVAFALIAWGGLRIDEAEGRVIDDLAPDLTVFVHVTEGHGLKSTAARRLVPLGLFAPPDIAARVGDFVARRRLAPDPHRDRLLDLGSLSPEDRFDAGEFRRLLERSLGRMLGTPVRPHDFRHTLISAVHLLFQLGGTDPDTVTSVAGWPAQQQDHIQRALLGPVPDPNRVPRQLSALAGHREFSPVSGSTYYHLSDLALGVLIREAEERMPAARAARSLGLKITTVQPVAASDGMVRLEDMRPIILDRMRLPRLRPRAPQDAGGLLPPPPEREIDASLVHAILRAAEVDTRIAEIADNHSLPVAQVVAVIEEARRRMQMQTAKKSARLPEAREKSGLLPISRFFREEIAFLGHLLRGAQELSPEARRAWAETILSRSDRHRQHLRFVSPEAAGNWRVLFPAAVPARALVVRVRCPKDIDPADALDAWKSLLGSGPEYSATHSHHETSRSSAPPGTVAVRGNVPSGRERRSFATLRRAAFCIAVAEAVRAEET